MLILFLTLLVVVGAIGASLSGAKQYDATARLLFSETTAPLLNVIAPGSSSQPADPERQLTTDVQLIKTEAVAVRVQRQLHLNTPVEQLLKTVTTEAESGSSIVSITARDSDPARAAALANAFADQYVAFRRETARAGVAAAVRAARRQLRSLGSSVRDSDQLRELQLTEALQTGGATVVNRAAVPTAAATPRPARAGALGLFLGLVFAVLAALAVEFSDRRLKTEEDVESIFRLPLLAVFPHRMRPSGGLDEALREGFAMLATNLRLASDGGASLEVLITSPSREDGRTSVTLGLAGALAQAGQEVIVLETDLRRPSFASRLGLPEAKGLSAVLADPALLEEEMITIPAAVDDAADYDGNRPSFRMLPAGKRPPNPASALPSPAMQGILALSGELANVVLLDAPPVGTVHDAAALMAHADATILVVRLNGTTKEAARRTIRVFANVGVRPYGIVVTDAGVPDLEHYLTAQERAADAAVADPRGQGPIHRTPR